MLLSDLKPSPSNPRFIEDRRFVKLKASIKEFPKMMELRPIIYDPKTMEVLGGNMRLRALQELKYKKIPDNWVKSADDLSEDEKKRFTIVDNISFGDWDFEALANEFDQKMLEDWGMDNLPDISGDISDSGGTPEDRGGTNYKEQYGVIVICEGEAQQEQVFEKLTKEGYNCKIVVT